MTWLATKDKQIANPDVGREVVSFTESYDGSHVLPLRRVGNTIYFKLNNIYGGSYYKIKTNNRAPAESRQEEVV